MSYRIELAVSEGTSTTEQGKLLENVGGKVLSAMQYDVVKEVRLTGMEVDLLAKHRISGEEIYVECKAHKSTLTADVITKIVGNVYVKNVSAGWLITTGPLGKDAKGIMKEWEQKDSNERRKLSIYTNERVVNLLISSGIIISDQRLNLETEKTYRDESILLISNLGMYWLKIETIEGSSISKSVICYNAKDGQKISDITLLTKLKELDTEYQSLEWKSFGDTNTNQIKGEMESIIEVSSGDEWADYRPSRPKDFVGRETAIDCMLEYFNRVIGNTSDTRLFSVTAPSGLGKSSFLLRLSYEAQKKKNSSKYFMYSVDVRAAISCRYAEFAIMECFKRAIKVGFIREPQLELTYCGSAIPFEHKSFQDIFQQLKQERKVIVLCFDQFEETFSKKELMNLFENIRRASINVDSIKENFILGFAWKTDVVIPVEHPAYHMWHSLSDRRMNIELTTFSKKEMQKEIQIFSKQLNQPVNKILREYLIDQCQGYPWLLKKLCIHVFKLFKSGINQNNIIGQNLKIENLFDKDLNELSSKEQSCIERIAQNTPADYYKILDMFGEEILQSLINKRLILRKGPKLILYWDIFRDYVLTKDVPKIIFYYIPQLNFNRFIEIISYLENNPKRKFSIFAEDINVSANTAQNIVKDLIMFGVAERSGDEVLFKTNNKFDAINKATDFFNNHILLNIIRKYDEKSLQIPKETIKSEFYKVHAYSHVGNKSKGIYFNKIIFWLTDLGFIENEFDYIKEVENFKNKESIESLKFTHRRIEFLGQGTVKKTFEVMRKISNNSFNNIDEKTYRNEITLLKGINLISKKNKLYSVVVDPARFEDELKKRVKETKTISNIRNYHSNIKFVELDNELVGNILKESLNKKKWSDATVLRYGGAVLRWYKYAYDLH